MSDRTIATTSRRSLLIGGAASVAALALAPAAAAQTAPARSTPALIRRGVPVLDSRRLHGWAADTWRSIVAMTDPRTGLPADNIPESLAAKDRSGYTSPTNIGGYLWSTVVP